MKRIEKSDLPWKLSFPFRLLYGIIALPFIIIYVVYKHNSKEKKNYSTRPK